MVLIIIIITLFQENNIFGMDASLTYGPKLQRHVTDNRKSINHLQCEVSVYRACCERATKPCSLGGGGTIYTGSRPAGYPT